MGQFYIQGDEGGYIPAWDEQGDAIPAGYTGPVFENAGGDDFSPVQIDRRIVDDPSIRYGEPGSLEYLLSKNAGLGAGLATPQAVAGLLKMAGAPTGYDWGQAIANAAQQQKSQFGGFGSVGDDAGQTALKILAQTGQPWAQTGEAAIRNSPQFKLQQFLGKTNLDYANADDDGFLGVPTPVAGMLLSMALGPAGLNLSSALGGGALGAAGTGALSSAIMGGDPLKGALMSGLNPILGDGLQNLGVSADLLPAATSLTKAALTGGDMGNALLGAGISGGLGALASAGGGQSADVGGDAGSDILGNWNPVGIDTSGALSGPTNDDIGMVENSGSTAQDLINAASQNLPTSGGNMDDDFSSSGALGNWDFQGAQDDLDMVNNSGYSASDLLTLPDSNAATGGTQDDQDLVTGSGYTANQLIDSAGQNLPSGSATGLNSFTNLLKMLGLGGGAAAAGGGSGGGASGGGALAGANNSLLPLLLLGGVLEGALKDRSTTQKVELPQWYTQGAQAALGKAEEVANQPYQAYTGEAVAPLSANEKAAVKLAADSQGNWKPLMDDAAAMTKASTKSIKDMDLSAYMNPYLEAVLAPQKRALDIQIAQQRAANAAKAGARGAFGTDRAALESSLLDQKAQQSTADLYGSAYSRAFDNATSLATGDLSRKASAGGALANDASLTSSLTGSDIGRLGTTGTAERNVNQAQDTYNVDQFTKQQDWAKRGLDSYVTALRGTGSGGSTTTTTPPAPSVLGQTAGALGTIKTAADMGWFGG